MVGILPVFIPLLLQMVSSSQLICQQDWQLILNSTSKDLSEYYKMKEFSGFKKNDLGNYESCTNLKHSKYVVLRFGKAPVSIQTFCGPDTCTIDDYKDPSKLGLGLISHSKYEILFTEEIQAQKYQKMTTGNVVMAIFLIFIFIICTISAYFDISGGNWDHNEGLTEIFLCFSLKKNFLSLLERPSSKLVAVNTRFLQGNKVLSLYWIILAHTFQYCYMYPAISNIDEAFGTTRTYFYLFVYGAFYAVDTFFWGVGFAFSFDCLEKFKHNKKSSGKSVFFQTFVHRYLQLTSTYLFCLFFFWCFQVFLASGPIWVDLEDFSKDCENYWATNLLYLNTFVPEFKGNTCLIAGWYIANDIQFLAVVLVIAIVFYNYGEKVSLSLLLAIMGASIFSCFLVAYTLNLNASIFADQTLVDFYFFYYTKPYCRITPCLFGVFSGLVCFSYEETRSNPKTEPFLPHSQQVNRFCERIAGTFRDRLISILSIFLGICGLFLLLLINFDNYTNPEPGFQYLHWTESEIVLFLTLEKLAIGLILSLILLPVSLMSFPFISSILSSYPFIILGKLNFCSFLLHNNLIEIWYKSQKTNLEFSTQNNLLDSIQIICLCELFAVPIVLFIEMPVTNMFSLYIKSKNSKLR